MYNKAYHSVAYVNTPVVIIRTMWLIITAVYIYAHIDLIIFGNWLCAFDDIWCAMFVWRQYVQSYRYYIESRYIA